MKKVSGFDDISSSRSQKPILSANVSPSSRSRQTNRPHTLRAGVPYEVPSSMPGRARPSCRIVSYVTPVRALRARATRVLRFRATLHLIHNLVKDSAMYVSQTTLDAVVIEREPRVVDAKKMQNGRVEV